MEEIIEYIHGRKENSTVSFRDVKYVNITVAAVHSGFTGYTKSVQEVIYVSELASEMPAFDPIPAVQGMISMGKSSLIAASIVSTATEVAKESTSALSLYATELANQLPAFDPIPAIQGKIASAKSSLESSISSATEVAKESSAALSSYATDLYSLITSAQASIAASILSATEVAKDSISAFASFAATNKSMYQVSPH